MVRNDTKMRRRRRPQQRQRNHDHNHNDDDDSCCDQDEDKGHDPTTTTTTTTTVLLQLRLLFRRRVLLPATPPPTSITTAPLLPPMSLGRVHSRNTSTAAPRTMSKRTVATILLQVYFTICKTVLDTTSEIRKASCSRSPPCAAGIGSKS